MSRFSSPATAVLAAFSTEIAMNPAPTPSARADIVLLAEDEDSVRSIIRRVLKENGYTVLDASGGPEALALAQQCTDPILLLITDLSMPRMSGRELAAHVAAIHPEAKILFLSGYPEGVVPGENAPDKPEPFLQKPFNGEALMRKLGEVLGLEEQIG